MLSEDQERKAFELLCAHWREGRRMRRLPEALRPKSRREGYAIQAWIEASGAGATLGWKLAATSREGQAHIGVDGPLAGRLLAERVVPSGATVSLGTSVMWVVEVEFVFRLERDLVPQAEPYTVEEAMEAVEALHLGLGLPDSRLDDYAEVGAPELLADAACANHFVLGPPAPEVWRSLDLSAHPVRAIVVGRCER
jgi:2-keto-4-pentenoate hydratase